VESEENRGSTFHFTARFGLQNQTATEGPGASGDSEAAIPRLVRKNPSARRDLKILLVEDNPINQVISLRLIRRRGDQIIVAANGREALAALERENST
jgi:hypothetical protein